MQGLPSGDTQLNMAASVQGRQGHLSSFLLSHSGLWLFL